MSVAEVRDRNREVNMLGRHAVVVGGTSGIGQGIALRLARAQASVTIVGRSRERGEQVVAEMREEAGPESRASFDFVECDAQRIRNVEQFANEYSRRGHELNYLVLTQGIATTQGFTPTSEGLDQKLALHYFSRAAFALQLLPLMDRGSDARVLTVLSAGVHGAYAGYHDDMFLQSSYSLKNAADAAGFYNDIMVDALSRQYPNVGFTHAAPGFVNTNWGTELNPVMRFFVRILQPLGRSLRDCGELLSEAIFNDAFKRGFHLMDQYGRPTPTVTALHEAARAEVWERTVDEIHKHLAGTGAPSSADGEAHT